MKRFFALFFALFLISTFAFADDEEVDINDDIDQEQPKQDEDNEDEIISKTTQVLIQNGLEVSLHLLCLADANEHGGDASLL